MDGTVAPKPIGFAAKPTAAKVVPVLTPAQINERNEKLKVIRNGAQTLARYVNEKIDSVPKLKDLAKVKDENEQLKKAKNTRKSLDDRLLRLTDPNTGYKLDENKERQEIVNDIGASFKIFDNNVGKLQNAINKQDILLMKKIVQQIGDGFNSRFNKISNTERQIPSQTNKFPLYKNVIEQSETLKNDIENAQDELNTNYNGQFQEFHQNTNDKIKKLNTWINQYKPQYEKLLESVKKGVADEIDKLKKTISEKDKEINDLKVKVTGITKDKVDKLEKEKDSAVWKLKTLEAKLTNMKIIKFEDRPLEDLGGVDHGEFIQEFHYYYVNDLGILEEAHERDKQLKIFTRGYKLVAIDDNTIRHVYLDDADYTSRNYDSLYDKGKQIAQNFDNLMNHPKLVVTSDICCRLFHFFVVLNLSFHTRVVVNGGMFFNDPYDNLSGKKRELTDIFSEQMLRQIHIHNRASYNLKQFIWLRGRGDGYDNIAKLPSVIKSISNIPWSKFKSASFMIAGNTINIYPSVPMKYLMQVRDVTKSFPIPADRALYGKYQGMYTDPKQYLFIGSSDEFNTLKTNTLGYDISSEAGRNVYVYGEDIYKYHLPLIANPEYGIYRDKDVDITANGNFENGYTLDITGEEYNNSLYNSNKYSFGVKTYGDMNDRFGLIRNENDLSKYSMEYIFDSERAKAFGRRGLRPDKFSHIISTNSRRIRSNDEDEGPHIRMWGGKVSISILLFFVFLILICVAVIVIVIMAGKEENPNINTS